MENADGKGAKSLSQLGEDGANIAPVQTQSDRRRGSEVDHSTTAFREEQRVVSKPEDRLTKQNLLDPFLRSDHRRSRENLPSGNILLGGPVVASPSPSFGVPEDNISSTSCDAEISEPSLPKPRVTTVVSRARTSRRQLEDDSQSRGGGISLIADDDAALLEVQHSRMRGRTTTVGRKSILVTARQRRTAQLMRDTEARLTEHLLEFKKCLFSGRPSKAKSARMSSKLLLPQDLEAMQHDQTVTRSTTVARTSDDADPPGDEVRVSETIIRLPNESPAGDLDGPRGFLSDGTRGSSKTSVIRRENKRKEVICTDSGGLAPAPSTTTAATPGGEGAVLVDYTGVEHRDKALLQENRVSSTSRSLSRNSKDKNNHSHSHLEQRTDKLYQGTAVPRIFVTSASGTFSNASCDGEIEVDAHPAVIGAPGRDANARLHVPTGSTSSSSSSASTTANSAGKLDLALRPGEVEERFQSLPCSEYHDANSGRHSAGGLSASSLRTAESSLVTPQSISIISAPIRSHLKEHYNMVTGSSSVVKGSGTTGRGTSAASRSACTTPNFTSASTSNNKILRKNVNVMSPAQFVSCSDEIIKSNNNSTAVRRGAHSSSSTKSVIQLEEREAGDHSPEMQLKASRDTAQSLMLFAEEHLLESGGSAGGSSSVVKSRPGNTMARWSQLCQRSSISNTRQGLYNHYNNEADELQQQQTEITNGNRGRSSSRSSTLQPLSDLALRKTEQIIREEMPDEATGSMGFLEAFQEEEIVDHGTPGEQVLEDSEEERMRKGQSVQSVTNTEQANKVDELHVEPADNDEVTRPSVLVTSSVDLAPSKEPSSAFAANEAGTDKKKQDPTIVDTQPKAVRFTVLPDGVIDGREDSANRVDLGAESRVLRDQSRVREWEMNVARNSNKDDEAITSPKCAASPASRSCNAASPQNASLAIEEHNDIEDMPQSVSSSLTRLLPESICSKNTVALTDSLSRDENSREGTTTARNGLPSVTSPVSISSSDKKGLPQESTREVGEATHVADVEGAGLQAMANLREDVAEPSSITESAKMNQQIPIIAEEREGGGGPGASSKTMTESLGLGADNGILATTNVGLAEPNSALLGSSMWAPPKGLKLFSRSQTQPFNGANATRPSSGNSNTAAKTFRRSKSFNALDQVVEETNSSQNKPRNADVSSLSTTSLPPVPVSVYADPDSIKVDNLLFAKSAAKSKLGDRMGTNKQDEKTSSGVLVVPNISKANHKGGQREKVMGEHRSSIVQQEKGGGPSTSSSTSSSSSRSTSCSHQNPVPPVQTQHQLLLSPGLSKGSSDQNRLSHSPLRSTLVSQHGHILPEDALEKTIKEFDAAEMQNEICRLFRRHATGGTLHWGHGEVRSFIGELFSKFYANADRMPAVTFKQNFIEIQRQHCDHLGDDQLLDLKGAAEFARKMLLKMKFFRAEFERRGSVRPSQVVLLPPGGVRQGGQK
ncbi:unnamed protein product [Amoebophrya sp. A25]|nr:unnamed protein product [Amoebophrya sp. A25]|eukprot:GSA25T00011601001.1